MLLFHVSESILSQMCRSLNTNRTVELIVVIVAIAAFLVPGFEGISANDPLFIMRLTTYSSWLNEFVFSIIFRMYALFPVLVFISEMAIPPFFICYDDHLGFLYPAA